MKFEKRLDKLHQIKIYNLTFDPSSYNVETFESEIKQLNFRFQRYKLTKDNQQVTAYYEMEGSQHMHDDLAKFLTDHRSIISFVV
jgi:hypothetical protein